MSDIRRVNNWPTTRNHLAAVLACQHLPQVRYHGVANRFETDEWIKAYQDLHAAIKATL